VHPDDEEGWGMQYGAMRSMKVMLARKERRRRLGPSSAGKLCTVSKLNLSGRVAGGSENSSSWGGLVRSGCER